MVNGDSQDQMKLLGQIRKGKYAPAAEADTSEAVKLNRNVQKPTCATIEDYMRLFPRARFFEGSNGRLCASIRPPAGGLSPNPLAMACGLDDISVI